jgi:protein-S-isoprenylcysteine O-methyltransferase Ste14
MSHSARESLLEVAQVLATWSVYLATAYCITLGLGATLQKVARLLWAGCYGITRNPVWQERAETNETLWRFVWRGAAEW